MAVVVKRHCLVQCFGVREGNAEEREESVDGWGDAMQHHGRIFVHAMDKREAWSELCGGGKSTFLLARPPGLRARTHGR